MSDSPPKEPAPSADAPAPSSHVPVAVPQQSARPGVALGFLAQVLQVLRFYSRLPVPVFPFEPAPHGAPDMATAPPAIALGGAVLGVLAGGVLAAASSLGLPPLLAAALAVAALAMMTGAMHEDGLADTADGFWGGTTRERRLEIMRDSRIGSYGAVALMLTLAIRVVAIATIVDRSGALTGVLALIAVAATSRVAGLLPLALLTPARSDGAAASVSAPSMPALLSGAVVAALLTLAAVYPAVSAGAAAVLAAFVMAYVISRLANAKIGGHTGDVAGAAQQLAEIAMLLVFSSVAM
jgi:adenosylcobinamide-GDP ribazoletransferase